MSESRMSESRMSESREQRILSKLHAIPFLKRLPEDDLSSTTNMWSFVRLKEGDTLWKENEWADALAVVLDGELVAKRKGVDVGGIRSGELLGEAAGFFLATRRSAEVVASKSSTLIRMSTRNLQRLRERESPLYPILLDSALQTLARRVRATTLKVAQNAPGQMEAPVYTKPSSWKRFWTNLTAKESTPPCPPLEPILRKTPTLRELEPAVMRSLCAAFEALYFEASQPICEQGKPYDGTYVIASGAVDVLREVSRGRVEKLRVLEEGEQFGMNALIESSSRTASCFAATPVWTYRMKPEAYRALSGDAKIAWGESMLKDLSTQIRNVNRFLHQVQTSPATTPEAGKHNPGDLKALLHSSGYGESMVDLDELDNIRLVKSDDQRRMPTRVPGMK